jgi:hypothetical protein
MERAKMVPERVRLLFAKNPGLHEKMRLYFIKELHEQLQAHTLRAEAATEATARLQANIKAMKMIESSGLPIGARKVLLKRCENQSPEQVVLLIESTRTATRIQHQPPSDHSHVRNPEKVIRQNVLLLDDDGVSAMYSRLRK